MNLRYRLAAKLLGYKPLRDPDDGDRGGLDGGPRHIHSWLLLRLEGSTSSPHAWLRIAEVKVERQNQIELTRFSDSRTYPRRVPTGTFSGKLG